ncbi:hypothetical protein [Brevibacillus sp. 179-C9.3 HS]|uniref:hypothetical protein n=1 Tax=unclassified Brevibacillus TaxID=2684853 RepID=UPI0039A2CFF8
MSNQQVIGENVPYFAEKEISNVLGQAYKLDSAEYKIAYYAFNVLWDSLEKMTDKERQNLAASMGISEEELMLIAEELFTNNANPDVDEKTIKFDPEVMRELAKTDRLISFQMKTLGDDDRSLEAIYIGEILNDSLFEELYQQAAFKLKSKS